MSRFAARKTEDHNFPLSLSIRSYTFTERIYKVYVLGAEKIEYFLRVVIHTSRTCY